MSNTSSREISGLVPRAALSVGQRDEMFALLDRHFTGVTRAQFEDDLAAKNWVIELRRAGRLMGFSTLLATPSVFEGQSITALYSGDTIVSPEAWNSPALFRAWIAGVKRIRESMPAQPCHWLLLTSGFRTYRLLPLFWREFTPRFDTRPSPIQQRLLVHLANEHYGDRFDAAAGLVRFPLPQRLRASLATVPAGRTRDPHIAHFLQLNPGHAEGDELVCLAEIDDANLTAAGRRMAGMPSLG